MNKQRDRFREEYNEDLKRKIRIAVDSIGGYTREEMFTLEFVYGAVKKYIPESDSTDGKPDIRNEIAELLSSIDNAWILDQIKRTIINITKEDSEQ